MKDTNLFALAVADLKKELDLERPGVGKYNIDKVITLHVTGTVTVGEDYEQRVVAKADPWKLLEVALSKLNGVTIDSIVKDAENKELDTKATKLKADAALFSLQTQKEKEDYDRAVAQATLAGEAIEDIKMGTWTDCDGKVTKKLTIEVVKELENA